MKKLWLILVLALAVAVAIPAQAEANHTLSHKVSKLVKKVNKLQAKVNCLRRTGASTYVGYAWYEGTLDPGGGPYPVHSAADDLFDTTWAGLFNQSLGISSSDYWLSTLNNTRSCRNKFRIVRNPYAFAAPRATSMKARSLLRVVQ